MFLPLCEKFFRCSLYKEKSEGDIWKILLYRRQHKFMTHINDSPQQIWHSVYHLGLAQQSGPMAQYNHSGQRNLTARTSTRKRSPLINNSAIRTSQGCQNRKEEIINRWFISQNLKKSPLICAWVNPVRLGSCFKPNLGTKYVHGHEMWRERASYSWSLHFWTKIRCVNTDSNSFKNTFLIVN